MSPSRGADKNKLDKNALHRGNVLAYEHVKITYIKY